MILPSGFSQWQLADNRGRTVAHEAAAHDSLPEGCQDWRLSDLNGWTLAHEAAEVGLLPSEFDGWDWATKSGVTVAHVATLGKVHPADFPFWSLQDVNGDTVAHSAAQHGSLPTGFSHWDLVNNKKETVAHAYLMGAIEGRHFGEFSRRIDFPDNFEGWEWITGEGVSVIGLARVLEDERLIARYEAYRMENIISKEERAVSRPRVVRVEI